MQCSTRDTAVITHLYHCLRQLIRMIFVCICTLRASSCVHCLEFCYCPLFGIIWTPEPRRIEMRTKHHPTKIMIVMIAWSVLAWDVGMSLNGTRHSNSARSKYFEYFVWVPHHHSNCYFVPSKYDVQSSSSPLVCHIPFITPSTHIQSALKGSSSWRGVLLHFFTAGKRKSIHV